MTIQLYCEVKPELKFHYKALAQKVIEASLSAEAFPYEAEVSLTLTDNEGIRRVNAQTRGLDSPTDVLSFPMLEFQSPACYPATEDFWEDSANPDTGEVMLGDIVLSVEKVRSQAADYGHAEKREYAFLITHSMLHLLGYDHMDPAEAAAMEERQRVILESLNIRR